MGRNTYLFLVSALFLALSVVLFFVSHGLEEPAPGAVAKFFIVACHELGFAFLVALVLNLSVEVLHRHRQDEAMQDIILAVFKASLRRILPDQVVNEFERSVFESTAYRENYRLFYTLERALDETGNPYAHVSARVTCTIVNATKNRLTHICQAKIEAPPLWCLRGNIDEVLIDDVPMNEYDLRNCIRVEQDGCAIYFRKPLELAPGKRVKIETRYRQALRVEWSEVVCSTIPSTDMSVEVSVPNRDFHIDVCSLHPLDAIQDDGHDGVMNFKWKLPCAALPGHGMYFAWYPKNLPQVSVSKALTVAG